MGIAARTRLLVAALALAGAGAGALLLGSCSLPPQVSDVLFEPSPPPTPVVHVARRQPYVRPLPPTKYAEPVARPRVDWAARLAELPRDANDAPDWMQALSMKLIDPRPGIKEGAEEEAVLDITLELTPADMPDFKATFPHLAHTTLLVCDSCHVGIFQMQAGADPITMEKIAAGEYCGRCHGKVAFDVTTNCARCHLSMPK
jgi:c(7)-type cytochrome triheme protein